MLKKFLITVAMTLALSASAFSQRDKTIDLSKLTPVGDGFSTTTFTLPTERYPLVAVVYPPNSTATPAKFNGATVQMLILIFGCDAFDHCMPRVTFDGDAPYVEALKARFYIEIVTTPTGDQPIGVVLIRRPTPETRSY